ncbi:MAG: lycopene cyclase domain-containing protein [Actinomycetes bacterium]|jgi:lycopene cyclase domain-containing protein
MSYSDLAVTSVLLVVLFDLFIVRTQLLTKAIFWTSYAIIFPMQLITNWWLTSRLIVIYNPDMIIGRRLAGAPIEDLLFGFSLILATTSMWVFNGRRLKHK